MSRNETLRPDPRSNPSAVSTGELIPPRRIEPVDWPSARTLLPESLASPELGRRIESPKREINLAYALQRRANAEGNQHFMVPQPLAALHEAEVPYQAVAAAAHAGEPAILPSQHLASMHCPAIPSILDTNRFRFVHGRTNRGRIFAFRQTLTICNFLTRDARCVI